jgi:hypothetical protein
MSLRIAIDLAILTYGISQTYHLFGLIIEARR